MAAKPNLMLTGRVKMKVNGYNNTRKVKVIAEIDCLHPTHDVAATGKLEEDLLQAVQNVINKHTKKSK